MEDLKMQMKVTDLPGVGKKLSFLNSEGKMMVLIIHHTGKRELYFFEDPDDDEAVFSFDLSSEDTKQIAAQMLGATFDSVESQKLERINMARKQVIVEWLEPTTYKSLIGMSFKNVNKALPNGVTLIGLFRNDDFIVDPDEQSLVEKKDTLMIVGKSEVVSEFIRQLAGKGNA